jgi:hypothetical protein
MRPPPHLRPVYPVVLGFGLLLAGSDPHAARLDSLRDVFRRESTSIASLPIHARGKNRSRERAMSESENFVGQISICWWASSWIGHRTPPSVHGLRAWGCRRPAASAPDQNDRLLVFIGKTARPVVKERVAWCRGFSDTRDG